MGAGSLAMFLWASCPKSPRGASPAVAATAARAAQRMASPDTRLAPPRHRGLGGYHHDDMAWSRGPCFTCVGCPGDEAVTFTEAHCPPRRGLNAPPTAAVGGGSSGLIPFLFFLLPAPAFSFSFSFFFFRKARGPDFLNARSPDLKVRMPA